MDAARKKEYKRYLKSSAWGKKKKQAHAHHKETCCKCGITSNQLRGLKIKDSLAKYLHVHHISYLNFKKETMEDLCLLCEPCHAYVHEEIDKRTCKKRGVKRVPGKRKFDEEVSREIIAEITSTPPKKPRVKKKKQPSPKSKRKKAKIKKKPDIQKEILKLLNHPKEPFLSKESLEKLRNVPGFIKFVTKK